MQPTHPPKLGSLSRPWGIKANNPVRGKMPVKARVAARPATRAVKGKTPAKARAAAPLTASTSKLNRSLPESPGSIPGLSHFLCLQTFLTATRITESESGCGCRTTGIFSRRNRSWIGSKSSPRTSWSTVGAPRSPRLNPGTIQGRPTRSGYLLWLGG